MAQNNLRILYNNAVNAAATTLLASSTASSVMEVANLKLDLKSIVWRSGTSSTTSIKANLVASFTSRIVGGVILAFSNLSAAATIRVRGYTGTAPTLGGTVDIPTITASGTLVFDTGNVLANPWSGTGFYNWSEDANYTSRKMYSRVWIPEVSQLPVTSVVIEIIDSDNPNKFVEVSRLIIGPYWSPMYNTGFEGLTVGTMDTSTTERTEAGDLLTKNGAMYNTLGFGLKWMTPTDRINFSSLVKHVGVQKPLFVSLFPGNDTDWEKEQSYQIYGKFSQLYALEHPILDMYSSQIEIEEI